MEWHRDVQGAMRPAQWATPAMITWSYAECQLTIFTACSSHERTTRRSLQYGHATGDVSAIYPSTTMSSREASKSKACGGLCHQTHPSWNDWKRAY